MAKKGDNEGNQEEEEQEDSINDGKEEGKEKKKVKRSNTGRFQSQQSKSNPPKEKIKEIDSDLLKDIKTDLEKDIKEKFGDIKFDHLSLEDQVKTMRNMLKSKTPEPKKKADVSDTKDSTIEPEWERDKSFLEMHKEGQKLKDFYDSRKSVGGELFDKIFGKKEK